MCQNLRIQSQTFPICCRLLRLSEKLNIVLLRDVINFPCTLGNGGLTYNIPTSSHVLGVFVVNLHGCFQSCLFGLLWAILCTCI